MATRKEGTASNPGWLEAIAGVTDHRLFCGALIQDREREEGGAMHRSSVRFAMCAAAILCSVSVPLQAQNEAVLKEFFEGRPVIVKMDMPASKVGIDVFPDERPDVNFSDYGRHLKQYGTAVKRGESILVTKIKVKEKHIEFQLGGGGFGTLGDDSSAMVPVETASKTEREKRLDKEHKKATDPEAKKKLKEELDGLKKEREREDARLRAITAQAEEQKKANIREQASTAGSRFNIRFRYPVAPENLTPGAVMEALARYVSFPPEEFDGYAGTAIPPQVSMERASTADSEVTLLKKGMSRSQVESLLGQPHGSTERKEGGLQVVTSVFHKGDTKIDADFVEGILVRYTLSSH
ncbi:MAG: hypothetical protein AB1898_15905 [Acidobacteriota bacterium]